jgi:CelD/BcsL family acetyltransferase involved in cellulose biosynthesis
MPGADTKPPATVSSGLDIMVLDAPTQFLQFKDAWEKLESSNAQPNFFQSYAWCGHTAEVLSRTFPDAYQSLVALALRDAEIVAIWPVSRQKRSGIWHLRAIDDPFGQISGILYADADAAKALVAATLNHVRERKLAAAMRIERVEMDSPLAAALRACGATVRGQVGAPALDLTQWPSVEALKASRNKKTMKNLRNATNRLSKAGAHDHAMVTGDEPRISGIVRATVHQRGAWLDSKGLTSPQFRSPAHDEILGGGHAWGLNTLRAGFELKCAGNVIAQQWGYIHDKRYYAYMSATDPQAVLLSPGRLHLAFVIADAMRAGVDAIEMLTPASDYKMVWTDSVRTLGDMAMPISLAGKVHDLVWDRTVRRALKAAFYALPVALRRQAVPREDAVGSDTET